MSAEKLLENGDTFVPSEAELTPSVPELIRKMNMLAVSRPDLWAYGQAYDWNTFWNEQGVYRMCEGIKAIYLSDAKNNSYAGMMRKMNVFQMLHKVWTHPPVKHANELIAAISAVECMQQAASSDSAPGDRSRQIVLVASKGFSHGHESFKYNGIIAEMDCCKTSSTMLSLVNLYTFMFLIIFPYDAGKRLMRDYVIAHTVGKQDPQVTQHMWQWDPEMFSNANMTFAARFNYAYIDQLLPRDGAHALYELSFKEMVLLAAYRSTLASLLGILREDLEFVKTVQTKILGLMATLLFTLVSYIMHKLVAV